MALSDRSAGKPRSVTMHVKKGDRVIVITGKDKGASGKVIETYPARNRVVVQGVNRIKKHTKPAPGTRSGGGAGGIVVQEAPIHASNVMLLVEVDGKAMGTRVGYRFDENGKKIRVAKRTGEDI